MTGQTVRLAGPAQRQLAVRLIETAPDGAIVNIKETARTNDQNSLMWASLSDISRAKPGGRRMTPDLWKAAFLNALGYAVQFEQGLDGGQPFPVGFRTSRLTKAQMADLITFIHAWGDQHGVRWSEPRCTS